MNQLSISTAEYHRMQAKIMTEDQLQAAIIAAAQRRGWLAYHTHDSRRSAPGFPDLVLVHDVQQRVLYRELKSHAGRVSPDQKKWLAALEQAGADAGIWRPLDWFDGTVSTQLDEPNPGVDGLRELAETLGIRLTDWQLRFARHALGHDHPILQGAAADDQKRILRRLASIEEPKEQNR